MDVFNFVEIMDEKYGKEWEIHQLSKEEQNLYEQLCDAWEEVMFGKQSWNVDNGGPV